MVISFFVEIDTNGNPKYKDEFLKAVEQSKKYGGWVVASKEYGILLKKETENVFYEIPDDIIEQLSRSLEHKYDRDALLLIQRNSALEEWMGDLLERLQAVEAIRAYGEYVSLVRTANQRNIEMYCEVTKKSRYMENRIQQAGESIQQQIQAYQEENSSLKENVQGLKEYIASTENYVKELQIHATNLDNELKYYKSCDKDNVEQLRKDRDMYYKLYKDDLEKMNQLEITCLELKEKQYKHR